MKRIINTIAIWIGRIYRFLPLFFRVVVGILIALLISIFVSILKNIKKTTHFIRTNKIAWFSARIGILIAFGIGVVYIIFTVQKQLAPTDIVVLEDTKKYVKNEEVKEFKGQQYMFSDYAVNNGISDVVVYIYASGTQFTDTALYNSIAALQKIGSTKKVKILALLDRSQSVTDTDQYDTKVYLITKNDSGKITSEVINSLGRADVSNPQVMYDFISFGQKNFPARKNVLLVDGVGRGPSGLLYDETSNKYMSGGDLERAISAVVYSGGMTFDTVVVNSSFSGNIELLASFPRFVKYMIASPDAIAPAPLNYTTIMQSVYSNANKDPLTFSTAIFNDTFAQKADVSCNENSYFVLYDIKQFTNISNGLESFATKFFRDTSGTRSNDIKNAISKSTVLLEKTHFLPQVSYNSFIENLAQSTDSAIQKSVPQLTADLKAGVVATSCLNKQTASISLPFGYSSAIGDYLTTVSYSTLPSFKELLRNAFYSKDTTSDPQKEIAKKNGNTVNLKPQTNISTCYEGFMNKNDFIVLDTSMGIRSADSFSCESQLLTTSISSQTLPFKKLSADEATTSVIVNLNGTYMSAELIIGKAAPRLILTGTGTNDLVLSVTPEKINAKQVIDGLDSTGQPFVLSTNSFTIAKDFEPKQAQLSQFGTAISYISERQEKQLIRVYIKPTYSIDSYQKTYNFFSLQQGLEPITITTPTYETEFAPKDTFSTSFSNLDKVKVSFTKLGFQYNELLYARSLDVNRKLFILKPLQIDFGADKMYYKGEVLPTQDNITFWNEWLTKE